jgi:hypothetical protein
MDSLRESVGRATPPQLVKKIMQAVNALADEEMQARKEELKSARRVALTDLPQYFRIVARGMVDINDFTLRTLTELLSDLGLTKQSFQAMSAQINLTPESLKKLSPPSIGPRNLKAVLLKKTEVLAKRGQDLLEAMRRVHMEGMADKERAMFVAVVDIYCTDVQFC